MRLIIKDLKHWQKKRDILNFSVLTLVTVILWIGFELYHTYSQSTINEEVQSQLEPFNPSLDQDVLTSLSDRQTMSEDLILQTPVPALELDTDSEASPSSTPISTASPSASPSL